MSLSTLLEAAKYLDYLDSNKDGRRQTQAQPTTSQQLTQTTPQQQTQGTSMNRATRRQRSSRKDAANTMLAMSLPNSTDAIQMHHGVPIPVGSSNNDHSSYHNTNLAASLSSSFTTDSPLSSFASTALLCSKTSGVTSASSSAASSLSSSDTSSSCGDMIIGDNDFNTPPNTVIGIRGKNMKRSSHYLSHQHRTSNKFNHKMANDGNQSFAHHIAATTGGPQLVTMTNTQSAVTPNSSACLDGKILAGHVVASSANNPGKGFEERHISIAGTSNQSSFTLSCSLGNESHISAPLGSCAPLIMARVQPMILNSISPSTHQGIMAFQNHAAAASSPTSSSSSYSRHRELHKTLEKNRRAHLRHCFEILKAELPASDCVDKKTSHINIIKSAIRYVLALRQKESEIDNELQRLTRIKNELADRLARGSNGRQQQVAEQIITDESMSSQLQPISQSPITRTDYLRLKGEISEQGSDQQQLPASEQHLSFLLSQSKID